MSEKMYKKVCVYCGKEYESTSRNQRYCSEECCTKANDKRKKVEKKRARKRRERNKHQMENILASKCYKIAHATAELFELPKGEGEHQELHHIDLNIFNNSPSNLVWLSKAKHAKLHTMCPNINMIDVMAEALQQEDKAKGYQEVTDSKWSKYLESIEYEGTKEEYIKYLVDSVIPNL